MSRHYGIPQPSTDQSVASSAVLAMLSIGILMGIILIALHVLGVVMR